MNERDLLQAGFRYALSLGPAPGEADDLVQEAWLRLHRARGRVRDKALLFRAIRNLFIDNYRRERLVVFEPLDGAAETADGAILLDDRVTVDDVLTARFAVTLTSAEFDVTLAPQEIVIDLDYDVDFSGSSATTFVEGFESATLGQFTIFSAAMAGMKQGDRYD